MKEQRNNIKKEEGITQVALIVTIIILLILAGIVVTLAIGDNGIITKTIKTVEVYKEAEEKEGKELNNLYKQLTSINNESLDTNTEDINKIVETLKKDILSSVYPIGSVYISTQISDKEDIEKKLGGKWECYGEGRTLVGVGTSDRSFSAGETGGESTHTLTKEEMPNHFHELSRAYLGSSHTGYANRTLSSINEVGGGNPPNSVTSSVGSSQAHNNLQPYITVYMWKRVE